jgi:hypothetical protein
MSTKYFRYKSHPGDFLRNAAVHELPNPETNLEAFLVWFLPNYQSDTRVAYLDDISKLVYDEFTDENAKDKVVGMVGNKTKSELLSEIELLENQLKSEAYNNFYQLFLSNNIEFSVGF